MKWYELRLKSPTLFSEMVLNQLYDLGAEGVDESNPTCVRVYFPGTLKKLEAELKKLLAGESWEFVEVKAKSWVDEYKKVFFAQRLSREFYLVPLSQRTKPVPGGLIPLFLEPGQAFGTGLHPSTQLALRYLENEVLDSYDAKRFRMLDLGTGSGILSIAAEKLGVLDIVGRDIDPVAVETARDNATLNNCQHAHFEVGGIDGLNAPFNLIVSNILLETHLELAVAYAKILSPGGSLILSGLLTGQEKELMQPLQKAELNLESSFALQEWIAVLGRRAR